MTNAKPAPSIELGCVVVRFWEHEIRDNPEIVARIVSDCEAADVESIWHALSILRGFVPEPYFKVTDNAEEEG